MSTESTIFLDEPVMVVCKNEKASIKLIKNATYYAMSLQTYTNQKSVYIKDVGYFSAYHFLLLNGNSLEKETDFRIKKPEVLNTTLNKYTGQFVRCRTDKIKSVKIDEIYYVEDQVIRNYKSSYNGKLYPEIRLKVRGVDRYLSPYNFEEIPIHEQRCIKLKNLNGSKIFKPGEQDRKFLQYNEKEKITILFEILYKVLTDANRIVSSKDKLNLIDLMVKKGIKHSIIAEDINSFITPEIKLLLTPYNFDF